MTHKNLASPLHFCDAAAIIHAADPDLARNLSRGTNYHSGPLTGPHPIPGTGNPHAAERLDGTWQDQEWAMLPITWTWHSRTLGPRTREATILEITSGLWVQQYVVPGHITKEEAATISQLIATGKLPKPGPGWEL